MIVGPFPVRFFWTDRGQAVELLNRMRAFRAHCFRQAALLAQSINAEAAAFSDDERTMAGFILKEGTNLKEWEAVSGANASGQQIYMPKNYTAWGRDARKQVRKFRLPDYDEVVAHTPFSRTLELNGVRARAQLQFHDMRLYIIAPVYPLGVGEGAPVGAGAYNGMTQFPGWNEIGEDEFRLAVETAKANEGRLLDGNRN